MTTTIHSSASGSSNESGFVRVTHGHAMPEDAAPSTAPTSRVYDGAVRFQGGEVQSNGVARYVVGSEAPPAGSVMATQQRIGGKLTVETEPGNPASRTVIETAVRNGLVRETFPGNFEDLQAPAAEDTSGAPLEDAASADAVFNSREVDIWSAEIAPLSQPSYESALAGTVAAIEKGTGDFDSVARALAEANGLEVDHAREFVETGVEWFTTTLTRDLTKQGLVTADNVGAFYDAARGSPKLRQAMLELTNGNTSTFRAMALAWKVEQSTNTQKAMLEQFSRAGLQSSVDRATGELMVSREGASNWVPLKSL